MRGQQLISTYLVDGAWGSPQTDLHVPGQLSPYGKYQQHVQEQSLQPITSQYVEEHNLNGRLQGIGLLLEANL